jgi:hypothetical protein
MGTWGPGNLDSDYAHDDLSGRTSTLVRTLWQRAHTKLSREADEWDYTTLFVELEILFALDAAGLLIGTRLPSSDEVRALATDYIAEWEPYYADELGASDGAADERKLAIQNTFERFAALCDKHGGTTGAVPSVASPVTRATATKPVAATAKKPAPAKKPAGATAKKPAPAKKPAGATAKKPVKAAATSARFSASKSASSKAKAVPAKKSASRSRKTATKSRT